MRHRKMVPRSVSANFVPCIAMMVVLVALAHFSALSGGEAKPQPQILIVGGGTSHDFAQSYQQIDFGTLNSAGDSVRYVDNWTELAAGLNKTNVLIQASNQIPSPQSALRDAILKFIDAGGGLLIVHAGLWYNWPDWPDYNRRLVAGGSRSHDKLGDFEVTVTHPEHPIMKGVPARFTIHDELYHEEIDPLGPPIEVLATATSPLTGKTYPSIWVVTGSHGKIACIALGHDQQSHNNLAYVQVLTNATHWLAQK